MAEGTGLPRLELEGAGIRLRPYRESDAVPLYAAARESVAEVFPWIDWCHPGYTLEEASQWVSGQPEKWDIGTAFEFVITGAASGAFLGGCPPEGMLRDRLRLGDTVHDAVMFSLLPGEVTPVGKP